MFWAKLSRLLNPVAKKSFPPGARSWMISNIAVPSSPSPTCPGRMVTLAGRSPVAWLRVRLVAPSESTPIFTPAPLTPKVVRAVLARCVVSPSEDTLPLIGATRLFFAGAKSALVKAFRTRCARVAKPGERNSCQSEIPAGRPACRLRRTNASCLG